MHRHWLPCPGDVEPWPATTLPCAPALTRSGHVLCPDKKHPASAHALEERLPRSWQPWPPHFRPSARILASDAAVRLSRVLSGGLAPRVWLISNLLIVLALVQWCGFPLPPSPSRHPAILLLSHAHPLVTPLYPTLDLLSTLGRTVLATLWAAARHPRLYPPQLGHAGHAGLHYRWASCRLCGYFAMHARLGLFMHTPAPHPCASPDATLITLLCRLMLGGRPVHRLSRPRAAGGAVGARRGVVGRGAHCARRTRGSRGQPIFAF